MQGTIRRRASEVTHALRTFSRLLRYVRRHRSKIMILTVFALLARLLGVVTPLLVRFMIDKVLPTQDWPMFWVIIVGYLSLSLLLEGIGVYQAYISLCMNQEVRASLSSGYLRQLLRLPLPDIEQRQAGAHIFRATDDVHSVVGLVTSFFTSILADLVSLLAAIGIMCRLNWKITLFYLVFVPAVFIVRLYVTLTLRPLQRELREHDETMQGSLGQTFSGVRVTKAFGAEAREALRYLRLLRDNIRIHFRLWLKHTLLGKLEWLLGSGVSSFLTWWIWFSVMKRYTSLGSAVAISWYFRMILGPFSTLIGTLQGIVTGMVPGERVLHAFDARKETLYEGATLRRHQVGSGISFHNVSFAYANADVLKNVTFDLQAGAITALVGPSGSGKTTIINLIAGFYVGYRGRIEINKMSIKELTLSSVRKLISYVPQDPFVFEASVAENIRYSTPGASTADVVRAARMAWIHERVTELPTGYETIIRRGTADLSAGERQRITIARAVLRDAPILILDEAFSNVDGETEHEIIESLRQCGDGKTILIVSHRLESILFADEILVLEKGKLIESDSPEMLVRRRGKFFGWVKDQHSGLFQQRE